MNEVIFLIQTTRAIDRNNVRYDLYDVIHTTHSIYKMATGRLPLEQRIRCIRLYSVTNNYQEVRRRMVEEFGEPGPSRQMISRLNQAFDTTGSVLDAKRTGRPKTVNTEENKERVQAELACSPDKSKSQRRLSAKLNIKRGTLRKIMGP